MLLRDSITSQGSVVGPRIFVCYINDLDRPIVKFAGDTKLWVLLGLAESKIEPKMNLNKA